MSIRRTLQLYVVVAILFILAVIPFFGGVVRQIGGAAKIAPIGYKITKASFDLYIVSTDYLLHPEKRSITQWRLAHDTLGDLLESLGGRQDFLPPEEAELLKDLWKSHADIKIVFDEMITASSPEFAGILTIRLQSESQKIISASSALIEFNAHLIDQAAGRATQMLAIFTTAFGIFFIGIGLLLYKKIARPIAKLHEGTEKIALGKLDFTVQLKSRDEFGELAQAFNSMAKKLGRTYAELANGKAQSEALLMSIGDGIIATDRNGKVLLVNHAACKLLGWELHDLIDKIFCKIVPVEDADGNPIPPEKCPVSLARKIGTTTTVAAGSALFYVRKNKTRFPVAITATPVIVNNEIIGAIESFRDLTEERKQMEDLVKFKLAVEGTNEQIFITDPDGVILYINKAAEGTTGYSVQEMLGKRPSLWGKQMPPDFYKRMWNIIKTEKKNFVSEIKNKRKNGQEYFSNLSIAPILDEKGEVRFFVGIERDLTKEKEIEKVRMDFLSLASHQLRTPLSGTKWLIETIQRGVIGKLTKKQGAYLDEIYKINERMIKLVYDMLSVMRLESAESVIKKEIIRVSVLIPNIVATVGVAAKEKGIVLRYPFDRRALTLETDAEALKVILESFLSNAIDYSSSGQEVYLDVKEEDTAVVFLVKDSGIGIPKEEAGRIFEQFYRASNAKAVRPEGSGLGLYIAKMLADKIGGKILFESEAGRGSTFYLRISKKVEKN